jgi:predicted nucleic acid-binding protein
MSSPAVVLDTNIFVAAGFQRRSASARVVNAVEEGRVRMVWNDATRGEIEHVMRRIPPLRKLAVARLFRPEDRFPAPTHPECFSVVPDPDDREFAALAHAAGAILITSDEHLLGQRERIDATVLTPGEFWRSLPRGRRAPGEP